MNSKRYWKNRLPFLLTNLVCMAALTVFLLVCGNSASAVVLILIVWALILLMGLVLTYWKRKRQMKKLLDMAKQLSERYLISEVMELPSSFTTKIRINSLFYCNVSVTVNVPPDADAWISNGCENVLVNLRSLLVPAIAASYPSGR